MAPVQVRKRLVEQQQPGRAQQQSRQSHPLLFAARELVGAAGPQVVDAAQFVHGLGFGGGPLARVAQHLLDAQVLRQLRVLRQVGHARVARHQRLGRAAHAGAGHAHLAGAGLHQPGNDLQQRAFAGPAFAGQRQLLAPALHEADGVQHRDILLRQAKAGHC